MPIPKRVAERIHSHLKGFQTVLQQQKARDVSEADTVTIVKDVLSAIFGYDKYAELTSEHSIRGTFCDLAVKLDGKLAFLIEVKAIGVELKDSHVKQAIDYGCNQGCEWVLLTNGVDWTLYHVIFKKPIDKQEVAHFSLLSISPRSEDDLEKLYILTREGFSKSAMAEYRDRKDATSRFMLAAIMLNSESVQSAIRREIRRVSDISVEQEVVDKMLREQVLKREAIEGEGADAAARRVRRSGERAGKKATERQDTASPVGAPAAAPVQAPEPSLSM
jgi:predicted type IV restriction endonuclease